jgi:UDP-sugar pyrophosphorylase
MPDFVNPKYKDSSKTVFKKPTRLECMMQDFPTVLESSESKQVGFTQVAAELCFSPVKNSNADGVALQAKGVAAATAFTGESDQYAAQRLILKTRGVQVDDAKFETYNGISAIPGPMIVLKPDFCCCPGEYDVKFPFPERVKISSRSSLVVRGPGVTIESLDLDGALVIDVDRGEEAIVRDLIVKNEGWVRVRDENSSNEFVRMRGFRLDRRGKIHMLNDPSSAIACCNFSPLLPVQLLSYDMLMIFLRNKIHRSSADQGRSCRSRGR